jgi:hypothetical protein
MSFAQKHHILVQQHCTINTASQWYLEAQLHYKWLAFHVASLETSVSHLIQYTDYNMARLLVIIDTLNFRLNLCAVGSWCPFTSAVF